ncbi:Multicopper oxidase [Microbacterium esteraromaticum]|uniref:Multicopper oxidase n=1 Tax=Microbacterium esteraromaticum TaxID=57043 RepID=A0A1R4IKB9_9MICO|nr:cupredoxin domain-containing protein [Microbacterium esteraromaticum]SJN20332.1 Multicopper oxidase [Microbacterium esteraromaticum]
MSHLRRPAMTFAALVGATLLLLTGCASGPEVDPTGDTTEVTVTVNGMRFVPDVIEVPKGNDLVVTFENTGTEVHDLVFENGAGGEHMAPGESEVIDVGVIGSDLDGWCSVSNHREMGMELTVQVTE